jgi:hypothetical protein
VLLTLSATRAKSRYEILLAEGTCPSPGNRRVIATGRGDQLENSGIRIHVDTAIHALAKTDYVLAVRESRSPQIVACGAIASDAPY